MRIASRPGCHLDGRYHGSGPWRATFRRAPRYDSTIALQGAIGNAMSTTAESSHAVRHAATAATPTHPKVSVVIPGLNESANIQECVHHARRVLDEAGIPGEVIVADNDSEDGSADLAARAGARVVHEPRRGYGSAYLAGFTAARGDYIVMGDADLTYDFNEIPRFVEHLDAGAQLVMGDRMDRIQPGAMP